MAVSLSPFAGAGWQFFDNNGVILSGGKLYVYGAGSVSLATTYTNVNGITANTNPIILNASGRLANEIWLTNGLSYKFILKDVNDVLIGTWDNIPASENGVFNLQTALASSTGAGIIGYIQGSSGSVATTVQTKLREIVSVKDFGAVGDGIANDTTAIQNALNSGAKNVDLCGLTYSCNSLTLSSNQRLFNGQINARSSGLSLLVLTNGCTLENVTAVGSGNNAEQTYEILVRVGALNTTVLSSTVERIKIIGCTFRDSNGHACQISYANDVLVQGNTANNLRYAGFRFIGCTNVRVNDNKIYNITGLSATNNYNGYGITFTSSSTISVASGSIVCKDCVAANNTISNVNTWNGLDTHGGENITFIGNIITDCAFPIGVVSCPKPSSITIPAKNVAVVGNSIDCTNVIDPARRSFGITISGESTGSIQGASVTGNTLIRCGDPGNNIAGAIQIQYTDGCVISGNTLIEPYVFGINLYQFNSGFCVNGNTVLDAFDDTVTVPAGIIVRSTDNSGAICDNTLRKTGATPGTYVAVRGIDVSTGTNNYIQFGVNFSDYVTPFRGLATVVGGTDLTINQLTDSTGGTANDTVLAVGATNSSDQSGVINNNFADLIAKVNQIVRILERLGVAL